MAKSSTARNRRVLHPRARAEAASSITPVTCPSACQGVEAAGSTLILTWIPNATLKRNPHSIDAHTPGGSPLRSLVGVSPSGSPRLSRCDSAASRVSVNSEPGKELTSPDQEYRSLDSWASVTVPCSARRGCPRNSRDCTKSITSQADSGIGAEDLPKMVLTVASGDANGTNISPDTESSQSSGIHEEAPPGGATAQPTIARGGGALTDRCNGYGENEREALIHNGDKTDACSAATPDPGAQSPTSSRIEQHRQNQQQQQQQHQQQQQQQKQQQQQQSNVPEICESATDHPANGRVDDTGAPPDGDAINANGAPPDGDALNANGAPPDCDTINSNGATPGGDAINANGAPPGGNVANYASVLKEVRKETKRLILNLEMDADNNSAAAQQMALTPDIEISPETDESDDDDDDGTDSSSTRTSHGPDSLPPSLPDSPVMSYLKRNPILQDNPESIALSQSLGSSFHEAGGGGGAHFSQYSPGNRTPREHALGVFSVNLRQMKSLRLFFNNDEGTCGQLVIASRESQYKIFHFHRGGLDRVVEVFEEWNFIDKAKEKIHDYSMASESWPARRGSGGVTMTCHPGSYSYTFHRESKRRSSSERRQRMSGEPPPVNSEDVFRKPDVCGELSHRRCSRSPGCSGTSGDSRKEQESFTEEQQETFWRQIQCTVDKDVVRTDRSNPFFKGENNPNLEIMRNILLNYAVYNPRMGYTQGMSDLLAPVLRAVHSESDTFWCFVGLMQGTIFVSSPKDTDIDKQLSYLRELLREMQSPLYDHLSRQSNALELLFTHRWILLCFKREFQEPDALRMWEACWAHYQTDYFHLFICVAIIAIYGQDIITLDMPSDEMLLHFSSLAMHMRGDVVLQKARGLLHQYRQLQRIPCTLHGLCDLCGPGMWDSGFCPVVECLGGHADVGACPHGGMLPSQLHHGQ
ncbi:PREDICTED: TBC1 domain family member 16-like [Priapulus caudatus]|uniref:TBC1 domain family member 16-like n=1 Tax=Priapulus caudatus TaxID=37621 RepID=A0ABM1F347_PRICU|nr:PREDICTED: TBC1 domain family member 16-like [Priapulus caudatus]